MSALDLATVGDANGTPGANRALVFDERQDAFCQSILFEDGVCVHSAKKRIHRGVDACVEGIGLSPVLLVDETQIGVAH